MYHESADSAGVAVYTATPEIADKILFESSPKRLKIAVANDETAIIKDLPTVHVYSTTLGKVENSGDSTVAVHLGGVALPTFKARLVGNGTLIVDGIYVNSIEGRISTGNGRLSLAGRTATAKLSNMGTGSIEAGSLEAKDVKCWMIGTGPVDCNATENLNVIGAGSGTVYYTGNPSKVTNRSIGVKPEAIE